MQEIKGAAAGMALIAIMPGFFVYHYLVGIEAIPMFAGGWASNVNLIAAVALTPLAGYAALRSGASSHAPFAVFVLLTIGYATYYWQFGADYQRDPELLIHAVKLAVGLVALYCVGFLLPDARSVRRAILVVLVIMVALTVLHTDWSALTFTIPERVVPSGKVSDYQGFATAFAVTAVLAVASISRLHWLLAAVVVSVSCLFLIGSRGDMLGFGLAAMSLAFIALVRRDYVRGLLVPVAYVGPIVVLLALPSILLAMPSIVASMENHAGKLWVTESGSGWLAKGSAMKGNFRNDELLDVGASQSLSIRMKVLRSGLNGISASPIAGDYAGQVRDHGKFGMYIHNILSAWQQYGIVGFLLYAGLSLGAVAFSAWRVIIKGDRSFLMLATLLISVYSVGLIFLTKSVFWPVPALAWGMVVARARGTAQIPS